MRFSCVNGKLVPESLLFVSAETLPISQIKTLPQPPLNPDYPYNENLQKILAGKQLLLDDLPFPLNELQAHYENGYLYYRKSILMENNKPTCARCGNQERHYFATFPCARCHETCVYCRKCIMMGRVSTCTPLVSWSGPLPDFGILKDALPVEAEALQRTNRSTSNETVIAPVSPARIFFTSPMDRNTIRWTKTSIKSEWLKPSTIQNPYSFGLCVERGKRKCYSLGSIRALLAGKRVCLATPRTDVVLELAPRLKKVFPDIPVATLYGGSDDRHLLAPLTIATTHQLLRFYQAFDVLIVDEVDAFPYSADQSLQYAVEQARKIPSSIIHLTATPNEKWQKECRLGKRNFVTIPARFHRYSLPIPKFVWCGNWGKRLKKGNLPPNVLTWVKQRIAIRNPSTPILSTN